MRLPKRAASSTSQAQISGSAGYPSIQAALFQLPLTLAKFFDLRPNSATRT